MFKIRVMTLLALAIFVFSTKAVGEEVTLQEMRVTSIQQYFIDAGFSNEQVFEVKHQVVTGEFARRSLNAPLEMVYKEVSTNSAHPKEGDRKSYLTTVEEGGHVYAVYTEFVYMNGDWVATVYQRIHVRDTNQDVEDETK